MCVCERECVCVCVCVCVYYNYIITTYYGAANPHKPAIPSIVLENVRSLDNKLDHIRLLRSTQRTVRDCCVFVFTETWLNNSVPDCAIQLEQLTCYRADRALVEGGFVFT